MPMSMMGLPSSSSSSSLKKAHAHAAAGAGTMPRRRALSSLSPRPSGVSVQASSSSASAAASASASASASPASSPAAKTPATKPFDKVQLGSSDLLVTDVCLGTMTWGQQNTEQEAHEQLTYAVAERGVNFIDTAEMYPVPTKAETQGRTDQYIASWLKSGVVKRDDVVIATKLCGYSPRIDWIRDGGKTPRVDAKNVKESVDASLKRLGIDTIDLLQIHWPHRYVGGLFGGQAYDPVNDRLDDDVPFEEQLRALKKVVDEGKVRYIGVSNETSWGVASFQMAAERHKLPKVQTIQNSYSLIVRSSYETDLAEVCAPRNCNVSLLAYSPLAGGSLSGKYCDVDDPATNPLTKNARFSLFPGYMERFQKSRAMEAARKYADLARRYGMTPSELALKFARSRWFVASTIIGATTMDQLRDNLDAFEGDRDLPEELLEEVDAMYRVYRDPAQGV
ncbi:aldo-keto reductase [Pseudoscourfieldia marina]